MTRGKKNEGSGGRAGAGVSESSKCISPPAEGFGQRTNETHLNRTSTGHRLPSSPSLRLCSHDARLRGS